MKDNTNDTEETTPHEKNPAAVALGSLGGKAKMANMTAEELSDYQKKTIKSRWAGMTAEERREASKNAIEAMAAARKKKAAERRAAAGPTTRKK